ncbi:hypothetical protein D030_5364, partial [Vibrio parahaemolyticus AQ3810]|jgi:hypothetical protein
MFLP